MEKINELRDYLKSTADSLSGEAIDEINFDRLIDSLNESAGHLDKIENLDNEYTQLRNDYIGRISGMIKAVAVTSKNEHSLEDSLTFIESLENQNSDELIKIYRRVQVKFQECFPASFGLLKRQNTTGMSDERINQYK